MHTDTWKEFSENVITHSGAHHLIAVMELLDKHGYARVSDVARSLGVTSGSASINLKSLKAKGLVIEDTNRFLLLSPEGRTLGEAIIQRRDILTRFFITILGVSPEQAEIDACKTEHLLSPETTTKMAAQIESCGSCPSHQLLRQITK